VKPTLRPIARDQFDFVAHLQVTPAQVRYSGTVREAFEANEGGVDFHAIVLQDRAVGFFKIDRNYPARYPFARIGEIGLRAFLVDSSPGIARLPACTLPAGTIARSQRKSG